MAGEVNISDARYPTLLKEIPSPPKKLFYKGDFRSEIFENCIAVVGSRKMSIYGEKVIEKIFSTLSKKITVVSGFMSGVDAESHRQALKFGLKTIAVMPCGIDYIHPEDQVSLYQKILSKNSLVISEYPDQFKPKIWTYPRRNRIVAGLSRAVVVIEASLNSGSLITAKLANSFGRDVFIVPGSIFSNLSAGKIQISNEFAKSIDSGLYINKLFGLENLDTSSTVPAFGKNLVLETLKNNPMTINEISQYLNMDISNLSTQLTLFSMDGSVFEQGGKFYAC